MALSQVGAMGQGRGKVKHHGQREAGSGAVAPAPSLPLCQLGHIPKVGKVETRNNREAEAAGEFLQ